MNKIIIKMSQQHSGHTCKEAVLARGVPLPKPCRKPFAEGAIQQLQCEVLCGDVHLR